MDWPAVMAMAEWTGFTHVMTMHDWHKLRALEQTVLEDNAQRRNKE